MNSRKQKNRRTLQLESLESRTVLSSGGHVSILAGALIGTQQGHRGHHQAEVHIEQHGGQQHGRSEIHHGGRDTANSNRGHSGDVNDPNDLNDANEVHGGGRGRGGPGHLTSGQGSADSNRDANDPNDVNDPNNVNDVFDANDANDVNQDRRRGRGN